jgi:hypothetical protein
MRRVLPGVVRAAGVVVGVALIAFGVGLIFDVGPDLDPQGSIVWIGAGGALVYWSVTR